LLPDWGGTVRSTTTTTVRVLGLFAALALTVAACGGGGDGGGPGGDGEAGSIAQDFDLSGASFDVGSKEFTENIVLGQITILALEAAGAEVTDQTGLIGSATVREALTSGEIDMYWDYTGTGWVSYLGHEPLEFPQDLFAAVAEEDLADNDVKWLHEAPFEDTYRIAITSEFAEETGLETMSDVTEFAQDNPDQLTLCAASEFINRDDGLPGLEEAYDIEFRVSEMELGLVYTQLGSECNFGEVFSTDGRVQANDLVLLDDDKNFFIPFHGSLTLRQDVFAENEQLEDLFVPITELLTDDTVTAMNAAVDVEGDAPEEVARQFLQENGFVG
jgi:osmoprotectant transport system substrate-binding protein